MFVPDIMFNRPFHLIDGNIQYFNRKNDFFRCMNCNQP